MKKNLRIVSAAAVSTVSADATTGSNYTEINLGSTTTDVAENPVDVTPSFTLTGVSHNIKGSLKGTISATFGGNTYTANLKGANGNGDVIIRGAKANKKWDVADVLTGYKYNIDIENVGFNFGSANANKEVTIASSNSNVTLSRMRSDI